MYHQIWLTKPDSSQELPPSKGGGFYQASFSGGLRNGVPVVLFSDTAFLELMQCHVTLAEFAVVSKMLRVPETLIKKVMHGGTRANKRAAMKTLLNDLVVGYSKISNAGAGLLARFKSILSQQPMAGLTAQHLAEMAGMSTAHFSRKFSLEVGESPSVYLRELRLAHARRQLIQTTTPLVEIAMECGFSDQPHFSRVFKQRLGITPARYRKFFTFFSE